MQLLVIKCSIPEFMIEIIVIDTLNISVYFGLTNHSYCLCWNLIIAIVYVGI